MDTRLIETFLAVAHHGSFAAAARASNIDPSLVSRAVASLEDELGVRLFQRTTRRMTLTEAGEIYRERVAPLVDELGRAGDDARASGAGPGGTLRLSASVAFAHARLLPELAGFRERYPSIALELVLSDERLDLVAARVDLAVRLGATVEEGLVATRLIDTRYRVVASPAWLDRHGPLATPTELGGHEALLFTLPQFRDEWCFRDPDGAATHVAVRGGIAMSNALALHEGVRAGLGPALLADWLVGDDIASGRCVDLFPDHEVAARGFDTAAWLVYPSTRFVPGKVRVAIDFFKRALRSPDAKRGRDERVAVATCPRR